MALAPERVEQMLRERFPDVAFERQQGEAVRDFTLFVPADALVDVCTFLRDEPECTFTMLSWMGGADHLPRVPRFECIYSLLSIPQAARFTLTGHPDLTRILLPEDWVGWPLRKDSPLGYEEVAFTHNTPGHIKPSPTLKKLA